MQIREAIQQASESLQASSPSALLDAQVLLNHVLQCNSAHLAAWPEKQLSTEQKEEYLQLIQKRLQGTPVAHLTGSREFWSLQFLVDDSTLIPRPETETLVEFILDRFADRTQLKLLDMGTGTGAIAIAIASEKPHWQITACDISADAIKLAEKNATLHQIKNIRFLQSDWFEDITCNNFDIIVSNPPYIASDDPHLQQGDVRFEPDSALTSGTTGMDDIEHLCLHAKKYLAQDGWLIVEHGYNQKQIVAACFDSNGFTEITQLQDLSANHRMTAGKKQTI